MRICKPGIPFLLNRRLQISARNSEYDILCDLNSKGAKHMLCLQFNRQDFSCLFAFIIFGLQQERRVTSPLLRLKVGGRPERRRQR